jgi:uncharacterized protein (TIGR02246 family)
MTISKSASILAASVLLLAGCQQAPKVDTAAAEQAMKSGVATWQEAYNAGDADKIAAMYADDGVVMAPDVPVATGRDAIRALIAKQSADAKAAGLKLAITQGAMGVSGDLAWHSGSYTLSAADGTAAGSGGYMELRKNVGGQWMIVRDMWNSDTPAPVAPGKVLRIVRFTSASADAQQAVMKLADEEITPLYSSSKGFHWVKYFTDPKTLATGSVTAWDSAADVEAFVKSDGYQGILAKLEPLMKGAMASDVYEVRTPAK